MKSKIKFPILNKGDVCVSDDFISVEKLTEKYESYFDYNFFEDELKVSTGILVDFINFDATGFMFISFIQAHSNLSSTFMRNVFLKIYNEFIKRFNNK